MFKIIGPTDILGDNHGEVRAINYWISHSDIPNLISVGDFCVTGNKLVLLGDRLNKAGKRLYVARGNHENPSEFDNRIYGGEHGGLHLLKDGSIAEWGDEKILFNGGGLSIDRSSRIPNLDYWEDEPFGFIEVDEQIDHLVTHISLTEIHNQQINNGFVLGWAGRDADLVTDLYREQQELQNWLDYLIDHKGNKIKSWHYGHYHRSIESNYKGISCRCLAINEIRPFNRKEY